MNTSYQTNTPHESPHVLVAVQQMKQHFQLHCRKQGMRKPSQLAPSQVQVIYQADGSFKPDSPFPQDDVGKTEHLAPALPYLMHKAVGAFTLI